MFHTLRNLLIAVMLLSACDDFHDRDERLVPITIRHDTSQPAADILVEVLDDAGRVEAEATSDINGAAQVSVDDDADAMNLRVDRKAVYLGIPAADTLVVLPGETQPRTVSVTFKPVIAAGDTWFQVLRPNDTDLAPLAPGESLTLRVPAEPHNFFVAAGNVTEGVRHAALIVFDGGGDAVFTDPIAEPYTEYAQKVSVSVTGLTEAPACRHQALPGLDRQTAALVYPLNATGFTVYSFSSVHVELPARTVNLPNGLACTYTAPTGDCTGKPVTALVPLLGAAEPVEVDWSTTALVPASPGFFELIDARLTNAKATQPYSRDKGGFCMAVNDFMDWSYLSANLAVDYGVAHVERFMSTTPDTIDALEGVDPQVATYDDDEDLHLTAACADCYDIARVSGRDEDDAPVTVYAPIYDGHARIPRELFTKRDVIETYGYRNAYGYALAVTLPMRGIGIKPGESTLVPYSPRTTFFSWKSDR